MAVNEISLLKKDKQNVRKADKVKQEKAKELKAPTKRTMNLVHHEAAFHAKRMIPLILVLVLGTGCFLKFGFIDQIAKRAAAYEELSEKLDRLASVSVMLTDYDQVEKQYNRYSDALLSEQELDLVDRIQILDLMEKKIAPKARIENLAINGNVLTLNLDGLTLDEASKMVKEIELSEFVDNAFVYSANAEDAEEAKIYMSVTLTKEAGSHD